MENVFAERLREAILKRNIKPVDLAEAVGLSLKTVYALMQGRVFPSLDKFDRITEALDVSSDYLLGKVDDLKGIVIEDREEPLVSEVLFIRRAYQDMSEKERKLVLAVVKSVLSESGKEDQKEEGIRLIKNE